MGRAPCCDKQGLKKGPWTPEEDKILIDHIQSNGHGSWRSLPKLAGLLRCGKSCRLRWTNYLRPDIKRGPFTPEEQKSIIQLHGIVGNKWSTIAAHLPGRTDNEIKNYWNTHLKKRLVRMGINPNTYAPDSSPSCGAGAGAAAAASLSAAAPCTLATRHMAQWESARLEAEARLSRESFLFSSSAGGGGGGTGTTTSGQTELSSMTQLAPDFFLRMWNSEVGEAFRTRENAGSSSPASSSNKHGSSAVTPATAEGETGSSEYSERKEDLECKSCVSGGCRRCDGSAGGGADSSSSNEVEDASEETYRMYLDLVGDEMGCLYGSLGGYSMLSTDLNEASLDTAFK